MIGIGITTRNRARILDIALQHFSAYTPELAGYQFFIHNDTEDSAELAEYEKVISKYPFVMAQSGLGRLGIAKAKNECIAALRDCDHIFLFDDDAFPKQAGWAEYYINTAKAADVQHLMHLAQFHYIEAANPSEHIFTYTNCLGVLLYFTKFAIETLGGYDPRFGIYGFEHAQISQRAALAGLTGSFGPYLSPKRTSEYIYSMDIDWNYYGENSPLIDLKDVFFNSSLIGDEGKVDDFIDYNRQFLSETQIHIDNK